MIEQKGNEYYLKINKDIFHKINKMYELGMDVPMEMFDVLDIFIMGAEKHGANSYLEPGVFTVKRVNSILRHNLKKTNLWDRIVNRDSIEDEILWNDIDSLMSSIQQAKIIEKNKLDEESGLSHDLHSMCNSLMFYIKDKRGIKD